MKCDFLKLLVILILSQEIENFEELRDFVMLLLEIVK